ncbi:ubiquitin carboxyl-terminal hydrolase 44-like [Amphiura filiformis]|uniref:ubiquitin carboxyl-terminal hydrolase 44-like n=1 Tax=Amphiura filiformis TaxID=82378 RepID=UPI003B21E1D9
MMERCKHLTKLSVSHNHSILDPQQWHCHSCGTTESVWACLNCSNVACGRYNDEHAFKHYHESKHPLAMEVNDRYVFCYVCDEYVLDDNAAGDLKILRQTLEAITKQTFDEATTRSGKRILRAMSVDTGEIIKQRHRESLLWKDKGHTALVHRRLVLLNKVFTAWKHDVHGDKIPDDRPPPEKKRAVSKPQTPRTIQKTNSSTAKKAVRFKAKPKKKIVSTQPISPKRKWTALTPGVTGLRNLGNTCYMNSILQVLGHLQQFRECFLSLELDLQNAVKSDNSSAASTSSASTFSSPPSSRRHPDYMRQTTMECFEQAQTPSSSIGRGRKRLLRQTAITGLSGGADEITAPSTYTDSRTLRNNFPLCHELHVLFRVLWSGKWAIISPQGILSSVWKFIPTFKGYSQHDAQEFLCELLDKVQSELISVVSPSILRTAGGSLWPTKKVIDLNFEGGLVSQVACMKCKFKSNTFEPFWDLSLEFPERYQFSQWRTNLSKENCHLTEMLAKFTEIEELGEVYACETCNSKRRNPSGKPVLRTEATKRLLITKLPRVLRLHLKRFRWSGRNHREKINVHVDFEEELNMRPYCHVWPEDESRLTNEDFIYDLTAVVMHHGRGFGSGHYTSYCWNSIGGFWVHCNDSRLELCSVQDVTASQGYIVLYTKRTPNAGHSRPGIKLNPEEEIIAARPSKRLKVGAEK